MNQEKRRIMKKYLYSALTLFSAIALSVLFFFLIFKLGEVKGFMGNLMRIVSPFIYGGIMAYVLAPICNFCERVMLRIFKGKENGRLVKLIRNISVFLSLIFAGLVIYILLVLVIPQAMETGKTVMSIFERVPEGYNRFTSWLAKLFQDNPKIAEYISQYTESAYNYLSDFVENHMLPNLQNAIGGVSTGVISAVNVVINFGVGIIVAVYFLLSRKRFAKQAVLVLYGIFPERIADKLLEEVHYADKMFSGFINGKLVDSLIIGIICFICCAILKIPYPLLISVIVGITNMIPFFGPFIGAVPCALIIILVSPIKCLYFIIFIIILQQVDGNIIGPLILGDSTGLNGFWILFALTLFSGWFGFIGMIIGVPLFAVIYHLVRELVYMGLKRHGKEEMLVNYLWEFDPVEAKGLYQTPDMSGAGTEPESEPEPENAGERAQELEDGGIVGGEQ